MDLDERNTATRNEKVLAHLRTAARRRNPWVTTAALAQEHIGGTGARTRVSNLRAEGHRIESRRKEGGHQYEYRYIGPPKALQANKATPRCPRLPVVGPLDTMALF